MVAGYAVLSASQSPLWGAAEGGAFANHGLDVEVIKAGASPAVSVKIPQTEPEGSPVILKVRIEHK